MAVYLKIQMFVCVYIKRYLVENDLATKLEYEGRNGEEWLLVLWVVWRRGNM